MNNSKRLLEQLNQNGFLIMRNVFNKSEQTLLTTTADKIYSLPEVKGSYMKYYENTKDGRILSRVENFYKTDLEFKKIINFKIDPLVNQIYGRSMNIFKDKINWKQPNGGAFQPHQDYGAWNDFPPSYYITCAMFADEATIKNGCLEMGIGYEKNVILKNTDGVIDESIVNKLTWKPIIVSPADLVLFDGHVPHKSADNKSENTRRVYYFTYNYSSEGNYYDKYFEKKREIMPPDFERSESNNINLNNKYNLANPIS